GRSWTTSTSWRGRSRRGTRRWSARSSRSRRSWPCWRPSRASSARPPPHCWRSSAPTRAGSRQPSTWPVGPECARATARAAAGARRGGGGRVSGRRAHGNAWRGGVWGEVAWAAIRTRGTSFGARFRRLARRHGVQKAVVAVMHHLLTVVYAVLTDGTPYHELG